MTELDMVLTPIGVDLLQMEETSAETSFSGSRYLFRSASEAFKVELTEQEDYDWRALLGGAYLVDHLLDIDKTDIMPHINAVISGRASSVSETICLGKISPVMTILCSD
jgi:hypothetical protein